MDCAALTEAIEAGRYDGGLGLLYGPDVSLVAFQRERYIRCVRGFAGNFGPGDGLRLLSVPGRSELGGNHTDHNRGHVLACAVDLDIIAVAGANDSGVIRVKSEGLGEDAVGLDSLEPVRGERYRSQALVRGVASKLRALGYDVGRGFDAFTSSSLPMGSGLSSSAAFEVMAAGIIGCLYNGGGMDPVVMAQSGRHAEQEFFGKPCGLMDQLACAVGGFIMIDLKDDPYPYIEKLGFDFSKTGHALCVVDTGGSHGSLTEDYTAVSEEMKRVAGLLGHDVLRDCSESAFLAALPGLRQAVGDRAVLRAMHFFGENERVTGQAKALKTGDFEAFKHLVIQSGRSSLMYLQNGYSIGKPAEQGLTLALALAERALSGSGAWRLHGGGFAGGIQAFVPCALLGEFRAVMEGVFGAGSCHELAVRPVGAYAFD